LTSTAGRVELPEDEAEHLSRVLRLGVGDEVDVFDGRGGLWRAEIVQAGTLEVVEVGVSLLGHDASVPQAGDHERLLRDSGTR